MGQMIYFLGGRGVNNRDFKQKTTVLPNTILNTARFDGSVGEVINSKNLFHKLECSAMAD